MPPGPYPGMDLAQTLLDSWDRQYQIVNSVASLIDQANRNVKFSDDGMALGGHEALPLSVALNP
ncbi:MAG: hypothetical protein ACYC96_04735 [Fimbriimonadaceae bacterium]